MDSSWREQELSFPVRTERQSSTKIHDSHLGLNKCKLWANQTVHWPGLSDQLENLVLNCQLCLKYSNSKKKQETNLPLGQEIPLFPWTKLATDLFHFEGDSYLLLVDYTSWFPIIYKLRSMTGQHIVDHFKQIFAEYGWPDTIVSDYRTLLHQWNLQSW